MTNTTTTTTPRFQAPNIGVPRHLNLRGLRFMTAGEGGDQGDGGAAAAAAAVAGSEYTPPATQADLDRIISERLGRATAKYADYDAHKAASEELAQLKAAGLSDHEKDLEEARRETRESITSQTNATLVGAEVRALAAEAKFRTPTDVVALLGKALEAVAVTDGQVDTDAVKKLVDDLATRSPYLVDTGSAGKHRVPGAGERGTDQVVTSPGMGTLRHAYAESSKN